MGPLASILCVVLGSGEARLEAHAPQVELGDGATVQLRVAAPGIAGSPRLSASVGVVARVDADESGEFTATYEPPPHLFPQVAIIALAYVDTQGVHRHAWTTVRLLGRGHAVGKSRPYGLVRVFIDDQSFGPVRADKSGKARVPIVVPPGVKSARDSRGNEIPLQVPTGRLLHIVSAMPSARADLPVEIPIRIYSVDKGGQPLSGEAGFKLSSDRGQLSAPIEISPGVYTASLSLDPRTAGPERIVATRPGKSLPSQLVVESGPGSVAAISVEPQSPSVTAGSGDLPFRVVASDAAGNPIDAPLKVESSFGSVGTADGHRVLQLPAYFEGNTEVIVSATTANGVRGQTVVQLHPAPAARLEFAPTPTTTTSNGTTMMPVDVGALDEFGNPTMAANIDVTAFGGRTHRADDRLTFVGNPSITPNRATLMARSSEGLVARLDLDVPPYDGKLDAAVWGGMALAPSPAGSIGFDGRVWGTLGQWGVGVGLDVNYTRLPSTSNRSSGITLTSVADQVCAALGGSVRRRITDHWLAWAHLGIGGAWTRASLSSPSQPTLVDNVVAATSGARLAIGRRYGLGHWFAALGYETNITAGTGLVTGSGHTVSLSAGFRAPML